eukprot:SAG22_NODE_631_length_8376_cov_43.396037_5_plen_239_part_00
MATCLCHLLLLLAALQVPVAADPRVIDPPPTPPPFAGRGVHLASIFSDHAVLQRAPATAAVYGVVLDDAGATGVTVAVASDSGSYIVRAQHWEMVNTTYYRWKAQLRPTEAGTGAHTITATCVGCATTAASATVHDVVWGDVWVCSGQSNMWLPMHFSLSRNQTYDAMLRGKLSNIRMNTIDMNEQLDHGSSEFDPYIGVPPKPYSGVDWDVSNFATALQFWPDAGNTLRKLPAASPR